MRADLGQRLASQDVGCMNTCPSIPVPSQLIHMLPCSSNLELQSCQRVRHRIRHERPGDGPLPCGRRAVGSSGSSCCFALLLLWLAAPGGSQQQCGAGTGAHDESLACHAPAPPRRNSSRRPLLKKLVVGMNLRCQLLSSCRQSTPNT